MYCRKCGKEIEDNARFCRHCGTKNEEIPTEDKTTASQKAQAQQKADSLLGQKNRKGITAALISAILLLASGTAIFFFFQNQENDEMGQKMAFHLAEEKKIDRLETRFMEKAASIKEEKEKEEEERKKEEEKAHADDILPRSSQEFLEEKDLAELSTEQLRLARNEIYAKHGYIFQDETLKAYFEGRPWYKPASELVNDAQLNRYESANIELILAMEEKRNGWKAAYKDFLENNEEMLQLRKKFGASSSAPSAWEGAGWGFELVYLDNDDIPELIFKCPYAQEDFSVLAYHDGKVSSYLECFVAQGTSVTYLEREGWIRHEHWMMSHRMDEIYQIASGQMEKRYIGYIGYQNFGDDTFYEIPPYTWEDVKNGIKIEGGGEEAYLSEVYKAFDTTREKEFLCGLSLGELYQILDAK